YTSLRRHRFVGESGRVSADPMGRSWGDTMTAVSWLASSLTEEAWESAPTPDTGSSAESSLSSTPCPSPWVSASDDGSVVCAGGEGHGCSARASVTQIGPSRWGSFSAHDGVPLKPHCS